MVTWLSALSKTRQAVSGALNRVFKRNDALDDLSIEELEHTLLKADVSMRLISEWTAAMEKAYRGLNVSKREVTRTLLTQSLGTYEPFQWPDQADPYTILVVGVNGSGKTTTCAKLARQALLAGRRPLLAAADTFRAAGTDQLRIWADRVPCDVVAGKQGSDAAAVAYDALDAAIARKADVVIVDTAGRMHTRKPLMDELGKLRRAITKRLGRDPDETWIVLDASLGQNAIVQAQFFHEATPLTGAIVAKLDGSAKAGFLFSVVKELQTPIRFAGLGEGIDDLRPFEPAEFVRALMGDETETPG